MAKKAAIADAVFKALQILLTLGPEKVHLPPNNFSAGEESIDIIRIAASSARTKLFEFLDGDGLLFSTEHMTPLLHVDPNPRWRPGRNNLERAGFDDSRETDDEKKQRIVGVVAALTRFCQRSGDGKFRPYLPTAAQKACLIAIVVPYTLKSIVDDHRDVFELHEEEGFKWSVSLRTLELPSVRELETKMVTDITAIVPSGATSSENHQANKASSSNETCVVGGSNPISQPLEPDRDDESVSSDSPKTPRDSSGDSRLTVAVDSSAGTESPPPGQNENFDGLNNYSWETHNDWEQSGVPLGRCQCGYQIPHWEICCWYCRGDE